MGDQFQVENTGEVQLNLFSADPAGSEGQIIYNSTDKKLKFYNGSTWEETGGVGVNPVGTKVLFARLKWFGSGPGGQNIFIVKAIDSDHTFMLADYNPGGSGQVMTNSAYTDWDLGGGLNGGNRNSLVRFNTSDTTFTGGTNFSNTVDFETLNTFDLHSTITDSGFSDDLANITLRKGVGISKVANPETGFGTYGSLMSGGEHTSMGTRGTTSVSLGAINTGSVVGKFENVPSSDWIVPLYGAFSRSEFGTSRTINCFIWNFNTTSWDNVASFSQGGTGFVNDLDLRLECPIAPDNGPVAQTDYVSAGVMYLAMDVTAASPNPAINVSYLAYGTSSNL